LDRLYDVRADCIQRYAVYPPHRHYAGDGDCAIVRVRACFWDEEGMVTRRTTRGAARETFSPKESYLRETRNALEAKEYAQWIAFGPSVFQAARVLCSTGILSAIESEPEGLSIEDIVERVKLSEYGVRVLLEAGLGIGLVLVSEEGRYTLTKTSYYLLHDPMTRANMNFTHDINYLAFFDLEESIRKGAPVGLKRHGNWPTVYEGLAHLPERMRESWFGFDQYYSDTAFSAALPLVFKDQPASLLDIGGNTGKWALACLKHDAAVHVTLADLPGQLRMARENLTQAGFGARTTFLEMNLLSNEPIKGSYDAIWMSQFLDCFSEEQIVSIMAKCLPALAPKGKVFILEPFWDRQRFAAASFSLQQTSLYFTVMANGNSQMYDSRVFMRSVERAGFELVESQDGLGIGHTLLTCRARAR
jgi:ubiquinone/menaquinone biosynthesis C-methylase UbiE